MDKHNLQKLNKENYKRVNQKPEMMSGAEDK